MTNRPPTCIQRWSFASEISSSQWTKRFVYPVTNKAILIDLYKGHSLNAYNCKTTQKTEFSPSILHNISSLKFLREEFFRISHSIRVLPDKLYDVIFLFFSPPSFFPLLAWYSRHKAFHFTWREWRSPFRKRKESKRKTRPKNKSGQTSKKEKNNAWGKLSSFVSFKKRHFHNLLIFICISLCVDTFLTCIILFLPLSPSLELIQLSQSADLYQISQDVNWQQKIPLSACSCSICSR